MPAHVRSGDAGASDSEDDILTAIATRKQASKPQAKATKARQAGKTSTKRKIVSKESRPALKDRTNVQPDSDAATMRDDEIDAQGVDMNPKAKRARTTKSQKTASEIPALREPNGAAGDAKGRRAQAAPISEQITVIPESQPSPDDVNNIELSIENVADEMQVEQVPTPRRNQRFVQRPVAVSTQLNARSNSLQPTLPPPRERSASASGTERRAGDPELRRKLNEMTKKYESMKMKNESLQELGKDAAETNFERLKRSTDQKARDASELIASLKKEVAELRRSTLSRTAELSSLQREVASLKVGNESCVKEADGLKETLQVSQNEVKSLETKLTAARQQIANSTHEQQFFDVANRAPARTASAIALNEAQSQKEAKMKENLYADLTGLLIRAVKRKDGEDEYDCIQTGRNGTMHFHLSIANDSSTPHPKTPSGLSYEEAEFAYEPLLDEDRDRALLELLPDYLTEEICFPRNHAQRFYSKVVDSMTKKIVVED